MYATKMKKTTTTQKHTHTHTHKTPHEPNTPQSPQSLQGEKHPTSFYPQLTPTKPQTPNQPIHANQYMNQHKSPMKENIHKTPHEPKPPKPPQSLQGENHPTSF